MALQEKPTKTFWIFLVVFLAIPQFFVECSSDPVLNPVTVTDSSGNKADGNSSVTWADLPDGESYKTDTTYHDKGLGAFYSCLHFFLDIIQPKSFPYDMIPDLMGGKMDIPGDIIDVTMSILGILICFVIGLLFVVIMPIVGCCFCCCRCCGNCGGKKMQKNDPSARTRCIAYSIVLFLVTIFTLGGAACVYVANDEMTSSFDSIVDAVDTNLQDLTSYMTNTVDELRFITVTNAKFTVDVVIRDLDNRGALVGIPVREGLGDIGVTEAINSVISMDTEIKRAANQLFDVDSRITDLKTKGNQLKTELDNVKTKIGDAKGKTGCATSCQSIDETQLSMDVDFNSLPDISNEVNLMNDVVAKNLTAMALEGSAEFQNIPQTITNDSASAIEDIKKSLSDMIAEVEKQVDSVASLPGNFTDQLGGFQDSLGDFQETIKPYNKYRWYGGVGLTCIVLLVAVLQLLGLTFGVITYKKDLPGTERGCLSNSGGQMLMAATGFTFIFSWLLMLLTCICFLIGAPMSKGLCEPLMDPELKAINTVMDAVLGGDGYVLGEMLYQDKTVPLTIAGVLQGCKANGAAYKVLLLENLFDINAFLNESNVVNIDEELDSLNIDLGNVQILSAEAEQQLRDFADAVKIDYAGFESELNKDTTKTDLSAFATNLRNVANDGTNSDPAKADLLSAADDIDAIQSGIYTDVSNGQTGLKSSVSTLKTLTQGVPTKVDDTIKACNDAETNLQTAASPLIKEELKKYGNRLTGVVDSFFDKASDSINNDVGKCLPIWNFWESMFHNALCRYTIDTFNGFWFGLGTSIFFMVVGLIFSVKLAKYFRTMKYMEGYENAGDLPTKQPTGGEAPQFASNKVAHHDGM